MELQLDDVTLHYDCIGSGIPLLCLPAFPFDARMWCEQHSLGSVAQLILPDLRGSGRSPLGGGHCTMESLASDMFALLDHLDISRVVVMGVSMGNYVAFAMYAHDPSRIRGLVIADTRAEADDETAKKRRRAAVEGLRSQGTEILRDRVASLFAETTRRERPELVEEMLAQALAQDPRGLAEQTMGMALRPDRTDLLATIRRPTLVLCGEEDTVSPCDGMQAMAARIPGARYHTIARAGHLAPLEHPAAFNTLVRQFLESMPD